MILVTGVTGVLGSVIALELIKQGHEVRATKRSNSQILSVEKTFSYYTDQASFYANKIQWVEVDFQDIDSLKNALQGVREVYHCAAKVSFSPADEKEMYRTNVEGTKNLLYACEDFPIEKFLHVSSIAVLDNLNEKGELDETSDFNSKFDHSTYGITKHMSEMEVWRASAEGLNTIIINPGIMITSGNWSQSSGAIFDTFANNKYNFSGGSAYVDVRDVASVAIQLMEKNAFGERFIVISENERFKTLADLIRPKLGLTPAKILTNTQLNVGWIANVLFGWLIPPLRMITRNNIRSITSFSTISNKKVADRLNYNFIPVKESIDFHLNNYITDKK